MTMVCFWPGVACRDGLKAAISCRWQDSLALGDTGKPQSRVDYSYHVLN